MPGSHRGPRCGVVFASLNGDQGVIIPCFCCRQFCGVAVVKVAVYPNHRLFGVNSCYCKIRATEFAKNVDKEKIMYLPPGITIC